MKKIKMTMLVLFIIVTFSGCEEKNYIQYTETENEDSNDSDFNVNEYKNKMYDERENIVDYKKKYVTETGSLEKGKLQFAENCSYKEFPEINEVSVLQPENNEMTVEESLRIIEEWLTDIGQDNIDTDIEIRDASGQIESNESEIYPYDYPAVSEHMDELNNGAGFFLNTNSCYIQMGNNGIYSMSDGTITRYLELDSFAAMDALGVNEELVINTGSTEDLADAKYELLSGEVTVYDAAMIVKIFFEEGTPYGCAENVSIDMSEVSVFELNDKYGYAFTLVRKYNDIPFAYNSVSARTYYDSTYMVEETSKIAYIVNTDGVCAYTGYNEAQEFSEIVTETKIIGLRSAVEILNNKLASQINIEVNSVGFVYCPIISEEGEVYVYPCWEFDGTSKTNDLGMRIYFDVLTGDIYYYTY